MTKNQYCTALTNVKTDGKEDYICKITGLPCVAREMYGTICQLPNGNMGRIYEAGIKEDRLQYCPTHNLPIKQVNALAKSRLESTSELEKRLGAVKVE